MARVVAVFALLLVGCGDASVPEGGQDQSLPTAPDAMVAPTDAPMLESDAALLGDGGISCVPLGQTCASNASCCSGMCDPMSKTCSFAGCLPQGQLCQAPTDCCSLSCKNGLCGAACQPDGKGCSADSDCCSASCVNLVCKTVSTGNCATLGNPCVSGANCCSFNCQGGVCTPSGGGCQATDDICFKASDCCTGVCNIPNGGKAGTCGVLMSMGSGGCTVDGEPCAGCANCCSRTCAPTPIGGRTCVAASGCRPIGEICTKDTDCCGGGNSGLPGANSVTCKIIPNSNPAIGTCSNPTGCDPDGDICGLAKGNACGNSRHDCCDCQPPKINCCKFDKAGVPRCYGGSTKDCPNGYTGKDPCCIKAGNLCAFSSECCNGAPCIPDQNGVLRCGTMCQPQGQICTATSDCCTGLTCIIPFGKTQGMCGTLMPPGVDGGGVTDGGVAPLDAGKPPCSNVGQNCSTTQPCCNSLLCSPPSGVGPCLVGETDCTCFAPIF